MENDICSWLGALRAWGTRSANVMIFVSAAWSFSAWAATTPTASSTSTADVTGRPDAAGPSTSTQCLRCHQFPNGQSHPVDVVPSMAVPNDLPLENGRVTCLTCHDSASIDQHSRAGVRTANKTMMLRGGIEALDFCGQCHVSSGPLLQVSPHATGILRAHPVGSRQSLRIPRISNPPGRAGLDQDSQSCLVCHDGLGAADAVSEIAGTSARRLTSNSPDAGRSHPIGVPYRPIKSTDGRGELRSPTMLDSRIRLVDGKVGCTSCHSIYAAKPARLVMSNDRSTLCLGCHMN